MTICPDCDAIVIHDQDADETVQRMAWTNHRRFCRQARPTTPAPRRESVMTDPTPINRRPSARELAEHDDKRIARQAQKVIAEEQRLTELWKADAGKAELRAEIARREQELKDLKAQLRGGKPGAPKRDWAAIRAWAKANGYEVKPTGGMAQTVVDAYEAAQKAS